MKPLIYVAMTGAVLASAAFSNTAEAQRQSTEPTPDRTVPFCRQAEPGETCRTRSGDIRIRRGQADNFGGDDVGFATTPERAIEAGRPETPLTDRAVRPNEDTRFGGEDIGFAIGGAGDTPEPEAMECDFCDDDEDVPQGPIVNTPLPDEPTTSEPEEEEDCEWRNPAGGPDQEFCDE